MNFRWQWIVPTLALALGCAAVAEAKKPQLQKIRAALQSGKAPVKIVCLGDSITGVYYHTGGRRAWPEMLEIALKRAYPKSQVVVFNAGLSGDSTQGGLERFQRDVTSHQPDLVVVMYGMNDMVTLPLDTFRQNLLKTIELSQAGGAAVVLCTQNSFDEVGASRQRTNAMLAEVAVAIREIGRADRLPVADCFAVFEMIRQRDSATWSALLSDQIHPNMDGHKRLAETVAAAISGKPAALQDVKPLSPAIPKTLKLLAAGSPIKVLAMPPYDTLFPEVVRRQFPDADLHVTTWPVEGQAADALLTAADNVRKLGVDLAIVAVPGSLTTESDVEYRRFYTALLNRTLSFGVQEYDVMACAASVATPALGAEAKHNEHIALQVIAAQDLEAIARGGKDKSPAATVLARWLEAQAPAATQARQ